MSIARAGQALKRSLLVQHARCGGAGDVTGSQNASFGLGSQQTRRKSGGHGHHGVTYEGLTLHEPARWQRVAGEGLAGLMWFWIFVRAYHDGNTLLFGHAQHFEHEDHHPPEDVH